MEELAVFQAAKTWITKNEIEDSETIIDIMKNVRFALVPLKSLSAKVIADDLIGDHKDCRTLLVEAMTYHGDVYNQPFYEGTLNKPRGKRGAVVVRSGKRIDGSFMSAEGGYVDFLTFPEFEAVKQYISMDMPIIFDCMSAVQINNFMFLFGTKCDGYQNFTMRYDASNDTWIDLAAVPREATIGSSAACSEDKKNIFLIGGMSVNADSKWTLSREKMIASIFMYEVGKNTWSQCTDQPEKILYTGASTLNNNIFGLHFAKRYLMS